MPQMPFLGVWWRLTSISAGILHQATVTPQNRVSVVQNRVILCLLRAAKKHEHRDRSL